MYDYILSIENLYITICKFLFYKIVNSLDAHLSSTGYLQDSILDLAMRTKLNQTQYSTETFIAFTLGGKVRSTYRHKEKAENDKCVHINISM